MINSVAHTDLLTQLQKIANHCNLTVATIVGKELRSTTGKEYFQSFHQDDTSNWESEGQSFIEAQLATQDLLQFENQDRYYRLNDIKNLVFSKSSQLFNEYWSDNCYDFQY